LLLHGHPTRLWAGTVLQSFLVRSEGGRISCNFNELSRSFKA
jgi:hypothetical protein